MTSFKSQAARDAQAMNYGSSSYWEYLDKSAQESAEYYRKRGDTKLAEEMLTRTLGEALQGNDGE